MRTSKAHESMILYTQRYVNPQEQLCTVHLIVILMILLLWPWQRGCFAQDQQIFQPSYPRSLGQALKIAPDWIKVMIMNTVILCPEIQDMHRGTYSMTVVLIWCQWRLYDDDVDVDQWSWRNANTATRCRTTYDLILPASFSTNAACIKVEFKHHHDQFIDGDQDHNDGILEQVTYKKHNIVCNIKVTYIGKIKLRRCLDPKVLSPCLIVLVHVISFPHLSRDGLQMNVERNHRIY